MPTAMKRKSGARWSAIALLAGAALLVYMALPARTACAQEPVSQPETTAPPPDQSQQQDADQQDANDSDDENATPAQQAEQPDQQQATQPGQAVEQAATPPVPQWPVNEKPKQAQVTWDSHGLSIDAANSSLQQILHDVSTATGTTVEGMSGDIRIFGDYGPGQARDVLSQLLQGAGYNVIMIGEQGKGAPRQILLTVRKAGGDAGANRNNGNNNGDDDAADNSAEDDQPIQPPVRPGFPGGGPRTPQQMLQEREQRLQQIRQMQMNQQQNPSPNPQ